MTPCSNKKKAEDDTGGMVLYYFCAGIRQGAEYFFKGQLFLKSA